MTLPELGFCRQGKSVSKRRDFLAKNFTPIQAGSVDGAAVVDYIHSMIMGRLPFILRFGLLASMLGLTACQTPHEVVPVVTPGPTPAPEAEFKVEMDPLVKEYLMFAAVNTQIDEVLDIVMGPFMKQLENVPDVFWADFRAQVDRDEMHRSAAELVSEYYTQEELEAVVEFLRTDEGKKLIKGLKKLNERQGHRSAAWARKIRAQLVLELKLKRHM